MHFRKALQRSADDQGTRDLGLGHVVADGVDVFNQLWKVQVAVGIGKPGFLLIFGTQRGLRSRHQGFKHHACVVWMLGRARAIHQVLRPLGERAHSACRG